MSDQVFEAVERVVRAKITQPKAALLLDIAKQIRLTRDFRQAERSAQDRADIESGHLQDAAVKIDQALQLLTRMQTHPDEQELASWLLGLTRIKGEITARREACSRDSGAPRKLSPAHIALAVMGALKRGDVPMQNWQNLTSQLLKIACEIPQSEATTGARYARKWMSEHSPK